MRGTRLLGLATGLCLLVATPAAAAPGGPDPSFGRGGWMAVSHGDVDTGYGVVRTADGRTVVAGTTLDRRTVSVFLTRYLPNGRVDTSFGTRGVVRTGLGGSAAAFELEQLSDGRLLVAGIASNRGGSGLALARFTANGKPDPTFGKGGAVVTPIGRGAVMPMDASLAADGSVAVVGVTVSGTVHTPFVRRFLANGSPDAGFAQGAVLGDGLADGVPTAALSTPEGGVVVVGAVVRGGVPVPYVTRYLPNGTQDPTFGSSAMTTLAGTTITALARTREGFYLGVGVTPDPDPRNDARAAVVRLLPNGFLDPTFGTGGLHAFQTGSLTALYGVAVLPDGRAVAAGLTGRNTLDVVLLRLTALGEPDASFGRAGVVVQGGSDHEGAFDLAVGSDGSVTTTGPTIRLRGRTVSADTVTARFLP